MTIQQFLSTTPSALQPEHTVEDALGRMRDSSVRHLPVVDGDGGQLVGIVSEEQLLEAPDPQAPLRPLLGRAPVKVQPGDHVFDVTEVMVRHELTAVPVATEEGGYLGLVRRYDLFDRFAQLLSTQEAGAILALEIEPRDYALSKLIHAVEQGEARVLSAAAEPPQTEGDPYRVTLKLNTSDAARVRHLLEHEGYHVAASFDEGDDDLLERVQAFMRYLEV